MAHQKYDSGLITWLRGPEGKIYLADLRNNIPESLLRDAAQPPVQGRQRSQSTEINTDKFSLYKKVSTRTTMTREKHFHEASVQADLSRRGREAREAREREQREKELREQQEAMQNQNGDDDCNQVNGEDPVNPNRGRSQSITHKTPMPRISIVKSSQKSTSNLKLGDAKPMAKSVPNSPMKPEAVLTKSSSTTNIKPSDNNKLTTSVGNVSNKSANSKVRTTPHQLQHKLPVQYHQSIVENQSKIVHSSSNSDSR